MLHRLPVLGATLLVLATARAQTVEDLRNLLRGAVASSRQTAFVTGIIDLSETSELSAATLTVDGDPELHLSTIKLPWRHEYELGDGAPQLHVEAGLGWFHSEGVFPDLWSGSLPGFETEVRARWTGISAYLGAGPRFDLGHGLHLTPMLDGSVSYLTSDGDYAGPGAAVTAALTDGIFFNWSATSLAAGTSLLLEHDLDLGAQAGLASQLRYDLRAFDVVRSTDTAQDAEDAVHRLVARSEYRAPVGLALLERPLQWNAHAAYLRFLGPDADVIGFDDCFEFGLGLLLPLEGSLLGAATMSGAVIVGDDVRGWTFGVSASF